VFTTTAQTVAGDELVEGSVKCLACGAHIAFEGQRPADCLRCGADIPADAPVELVDEERWTIVGETGIAMVRYDAFTRAEAEEIVAGGCVDWQGRHYAVPASVARRLSETFKAIGQRHDEAKAIEREHAVRIELGLLAASELDVELDEVRVHHAGHGRGWFVSRRYMVEGFAKSITAAGPFTTREAAEAKADELR
jgi:hypothetical protein